MSDMIIEQGPLVLFALVIAAGCIIASPYGEKLLVGKGRTSRLLMAAFIVQMAGLLASVWTWMIHNQLAGSGSSGFCAAEGIIQCGSVIGDPYYSKDPILGMPWGIVGLLAFSVLGYLTVAAYMDMEEDWSKKFVNAAYWISLPGIVGIVWLVIVELFLVQDAPHICPYCTSVHIALIAVIVILYMVRVDQDSGIWESDPPVVKEKVNEKKTKVKKSVSVTKESKSITQEKMDADDEDYELTSSGVKSKVSSKKNKSKTRKKSKRRKR
ncbi:MAG: vitamin K epoxide reductase family protein [Candidatus Thalassarchaeaceae archaeon]|jgi:uncharacterized membrane protein|nr:vitamin K epoxide reductase family protein [Candidatus Thalassarchaeaceae archaeon]